MSAQQVVQDLQTNAKMDEFKTYLDAKSAAQEKFQADVLVMMSSLGNAVTSLQSGMTGMTDAMDVLHTRVTDASTEQQKRAEGVANEQKKLAERIEKSSKDLAVRVKKAHDTIGRVYEMNARQTIAAIHGTKWARSFNVEGLIG
jgi:hypothetical protein